MLILCIDTAGADCAVLLARDGETLAQARETLGRGHAERLAPMTQELLARAGAEIAALDRVAVVTGPGSFAGIRVGVAFARGLGLTLDIPVLGVSLFDLMAHAHGGAPLLAAMHDAARGEVAFQLYRFSQAESDLKRMPVSDAAAHIAATGAEPLLAGSAAGLLAPLIPAARTAPPEAEPLLRMAQIASQADPAANPPEPLYVRPPDAKLPGGKTLDEA